MLQTLPDFHITLLGKEIAPTASAQDLGVQVDATLSYNEVKSAYEPSGPPGRSLSRFL